MVYRLFECATLFLFVEIVVFWRGNYCKPILNVTILGVFTRNKKFTGSVCIFYSGNVSILQTLERTHQLIDSDSIIRIMNLNSIAMKRNDNAIFKAARGSFWEWRCSFLNRVFGM